MSFSGRKHWPNNIIYRTKNWFFSFSAVNQKELDRPLQDNNREIDTKSDVQIVPSLLTSCRGDFLTNLVVSLRSIPLKPLILKLIQGGHTVLTVFRQQLQKLVSLLNVRRRTLMSTADINEKINRSLADSHGRWGWLEYVGLVKEKWQLHAISCLSCSCTPLYQLQTHLKIRVKGL